MSVWLFLVLGLVALSQSGNIVRLSDASPAGIATWRLLLAGAVMLPLAGTKGAARLSGLGRLDWALLVLAGAGLAGHLLSWIAAVQHTKVANASLFFGFNPVLTVTAAHFFYRERVSRWLMVSIALGVVGLAAIAAEDLDLSPASAVGDAYALLCAALFTAYFLLGKRLRRKLDSRSYVAALYSIAAIVCLAVLAAQGGPLFDYSLRNWGVFAAMAVVPTLIGHTSLNHALAHIDASWLSVATLSEPLLAGLVAWWAWGEAVTPVMLVGYGLLLASVLVLVRVSGQKSLA